MSIAPSSATFTEPISATAAAKVLVLRSCRPHVLQEAFHAIRARWPGAEITVLAHEGHADALRRLGADDVVEVPGARFGLARTPLRTWRALWEGRYHAVVVPQMFASLAGHTNLYRLALAIGAPVVALFDQSNALRLYSRIGLLSTLARHWRVFVQPAVDVPLLLALLLVSLAYPRRRGEPQARRVLHVITSWGIGGAQRQLAELVKHCPPDVSMDILVLAAADGDFSTRHLDGHHVRIRYAQGWPLLAPTVLEIAALCRAERYDVVHTWLFLANVLGVAGARLAGVPRVVSSVRNLSLWKRTWAARPWFRVADMLASRASDIVTVNASPLVPDHAAWARIAPGRIDVVPNGLATDGLAIDPLSARVALRQTLNVGPAVWLVGTVGRLAPEKDQALLLDAWARVTGILPNAHLVIVGDGPLRPALEAQIAAAGLPVTLVGESANARQIMAGLDLFVLPSRIEGFANVLLEATMLGVPVLATDVGAARDVVVDAEDLVPVASVDALATALVSHLTDLTGSRVRAVRRQTFVRDTFTIDRMVERWLSLYARS